MTDEPEHEPTPDLPAAPPPAELSGQPMQQVGPNQWAAYPSGYGVPDPQPGVIPLRPLGLGDMFTGAFGTIRRNWQLMLGVSLVVGLITQAITVPLQWLFTKDLPVPVAGKVPTSGELGEFLGGKAISTFASLAVTVVLAVGLWAVLTMVVSRAVLGVRAEFGDVWQAAVPRMLPLLGQQLLAGLIIAAPVAGAVILGLALDVAAESGPAFTVLFGLVGLVFSVYLSVSLSMASSAVVLEGASPVTSLRRSRLLTKDNWWRVLGISLLAGLAGGLAALVIELPFGLAQMTASLSHTTAAPDLKSLIASGVGAAIASAVVTPFTIGVDVLLYHDLRFRKEGLHQQIVSTLPG
jgi:hypothetical protein